jgi:hypothetical protein
MTKQSLNDPVVFRLIVAKNDSKNNGIDIKTTLIQFVGTVHDDQFILIEGQCRFR